MTALNQNIVSTKVFVVDSESLTISPVWVYRHNEGAYWKDDLNETKVELSKGQSIRKSKEDAERALLTSMEMEVHAMEERLQAMQDWLQRNDWPLDVLKIRLKDKKATQEL